MKILILSFLAWTLSAEPGQQLAQSMRQSQLLLSESFRGSLKTYSRDRRGRQINQLIQFRSNVNGNPNHCEFVVTNNGEFRHNTIDGRRQSEYYSRLTVINDGQSSRCYVSNNSKQLGRLITLPQESMSSFALSDFWPADLGLEFFYWPRQKILPNIRIKMRKGIACQVLESSRQPAVPFGYSRVRSWISREHFGLIYAEAYNADGRRVKTFEVSSLQKINGQWKVKELRIRNEITKSTTKIIIDNHEPK